MMKTNLLKETKEILKEHGKTVKDIRWVGIGYGGDGFGEVSVDKFLQIADNYYDSDYGHVEITMGLIIVGDDWWLERDEYDGAEGWEFRRMPTRPEVKHDLTKYDIFLYYVPEEDPEWED